MNRNERGPQPGEKTNGEHKQWEKEVMKKKITVYLLTNF